MTTLKAYTEKLVFELRMRNVPGAVIGDVIAQVESHVAETHEDPEDAFGTPREYARAYSGPRTSGRRWLFYALSWCIGFGFGALLLSGILAWIGGTAALWGWNPVLCTVLGAIGLLGFGIYLFLVVADRITDPREAEGSGVHSGDG